MLQPAAAEAGGHAGADSDGEFAGGGLEVVQDFLGGFEVQPGRNAIAFLGPNFFTKFLYFAGGGESSHPCLIVDNRVLVSLFRETRNSVFAPRTTNYGVQVYESALSQMVEWAEGLSHAGRTVGPDEVER